MVKAKPKKDEGTVEFVGGLIRKVATVIDTDSNDDTL